MMKKRAKRNKAENKYTTERVTEAESELFEKINKIGKPLSLI